MMHQSVETELCVGVFLSPPDERGVYTDPGDSADSVNSGGSATSSGESVNSLNLTEDPPPADGLVSWLLLNTCGHLGYAHTLEGWRRRGFARLALAELTRRCLRRGLPAVVSTHEENHGMVGAMRGLRYAPVHDVFWAVVRPLAPADGDQNT